VYVSWIHFTGEIMAFGFGVVWAWINVVLSFITRPQLSSLFICSIRLILTLLASAATVIREFVPVLFLPREALRSAVLS